MAAQLFAAAVMLQLIAITAMAADDATGRPSAVIEPAKTSVPGATEDYSGLFPGTGGAGGHELPQQKPAITAPMPTYESWDVLRQYPRFVPIPKSPVINEISEDK